MDNASTMKLHVYRMAQNFDGGKFWRIRVGKILMSKKLTNANAFNLSSCLLLTHADLLVIVGRESYAWEKICE